MMPSSVSVDSDSKRLQAQPDGGKHLQELKGNLVSLTRKERATQLTYNLCPRGSVDSLVPGGEANQHSVTSV